MAISWAFLGSDFIFWGLMTMLVFSFLLPKQQHIIQAWYFVGTSKIAVCAGVVLCFFIGITALDSIHFTHAQADNKIYSLLDVMFSPLDKEMETSYSAPFATHAYIASPVTVSPGKIEMLKVSLDYVDPQIISGKKSMAWDMAKRVMKGIIGGTVIWLSVLGILLIFIPVEKFYLKTRYTFQWPTFAMTLGILCAIVGSLVALSKGYHILGTDKVGEDVFYQSIKSIRTGVLIGTLTTLVLLPFALLLGMLAGFFRGWIDDVIQYLYTVLSAIPNVLLIAASVLMLDVVIDQHSHFVSAEMRADLRLLALCAILGVTSWTSLCRLVRGETLKLREQDYVKAAVALGTRPLGILKRHILPNLMHIIFITITLDFSGLVLAEAVLSYVGVGVDPSTYSWGNMINVARQELAREPIVWWSLSGAFIFMVSLVLPANLFADVVQKAFDPRGRQVNDE